VCFVGDSFVQGTGDEHALGWVGRLCAAADARGWAVTGYNLGVRRETSADIRRRWEVECRPRLPAGCDARLVFSFGVNDTTLEGGRPRVPHDETIENGRAILEAARARYSTLLVGPPLTAEDGQNALVARLLAGQLEVPFIELYEPLSTDERYRREIAEGDGAHPGAAGYARIAAVVEASPRWWFAAVAPA
jgi:lysophospholipase L1-like esterase